MTEEMICVNCGERFNPPTEEGHCPRCRRMRNKAMARKLSMGAAVDVKDFERTPDGDYVLPDYAADIDYCDSRTEEWIHSIGREFTGRRRILASTTNRYYKNHNFVCLWLR